MKFFLSRDWTKHVTLGNKNWGISEAYVKILKHQNTSYLQLSRQTSSEYYKTHFSQCKYMCQRLLKLRNGD